MDSNTEIIKIEKSKNGIIHLSPISKHLSFDQGLILTIEAVEALRVKLEDSCIIIGLAGPPGVGKSTFARKIQSILDADVIPLHLFVKWNLVTDGNHEDPAVFDFSLLRSSIQSLQRGDSVKLQSKYRINSEIRTITIRPPASKVIVLDGTYTLNELIRDVLNVTISLNGGIHFHLLQRIIGDTTSLKHYKKALHQITDLVFPIYKTYIEPDLQHAQIRIFSQFNPMSSIANPRYVFKTKLSNLKNTSVSALIALIRKYAKKNGIEEKSVESFRSKSKKSIDLSDMFLYPPSSQNFNGKSSSNDNWIRARRYPGGIFTLSFSPISTGKDLNESAQIHFEISVQTIAGLLSLDYQFGAILNRTRKTLFHSLNGNFRVTIDSLKASNESYLQISSIDRQKVLKLARFLGVEAEHIPATFLSLYQQHLKDGLPLSLPKQQESVGKTEKDCPKL